MKEKKIIAIGGGSARNLFRRPSSTLAIDIEAMRLATAGSNNWIGQPKLLFIPTASQDDLLYSEDMYTSFATHLGCKYKDLLLVAERNTRREIENKIDWADIIYVGGGNTRDMMNIWNKTGVSELLHQAHESGKVLMGVSAGSICWFEGGLSDSNKFDGDPNWKPMWVQGLGLIPILNSPHIDSELWREVELERCLETGELPKPVLALEDNCAIEVVGDTYRIINSQRGKRAYLYCGNTKRVILPSLKFLPLEDLVTTPDH